MFDIGFSEVLLIFVIALIVLGPEKLPRVASQVGRWIGRARTMARQFREQLEEEVNLEQVRKAHETKPRKPEEPGTATATPESPVSGTNSPTADGAPSGDFSNASAGSGEGSNSGGGSAVGSSVPHETTDTGGAGGSSSEAAPFTASTAGHEGGYGPAYTGPDPADLRADTFSHAHPTDEYGANPHAPNGAASEADVGAAQPEPPAADTRQQRAANPEAYASNTPPPLKEDNRGHS